MKEGRRRGERDGKETALSVLVLPSPFPGRTSRPTKKGRKSKIKGKDCMGVKRE